MPLLEQAAVTAATNAQYWKAYGVALAAGRDYSAALEPFGRACQLNPKLADACYYYGRALYAADRYDQALAPLETALKADGIKARAETALGECAEALGRPEEAEKRFRSALGRQDEWLIRTRIAYGRFLTRAGRIEEAIAELERAQRPESIEALEEYARALLQADRPADALPKLERILQLDPSHLNGHLLAAKAYRRLSRMADAVRHEQAARALQGSSMVR